LFLRFCTRFHANKGILVINFNNMGEFDSIRELSIVRRDCCAIILLYAV